MKISLQWLNTLLDRPVDADEAERLLTDLGLPIETRAPGIPASGGDTMLDVEVTSNRSDCLSHIGVAREVAAASGRRVVMPKALSELDCFAAATTVHSLTSVKNERTDLCPLYTARVVRGVKIGPSPAWLAQRLETIGLRPINNVVDVTNYVLMELGQPLHAFDLGKLNDQRIVVRSASPGEPFVAIDGSKHALKENMLVIADAKKPQAIAGVMGGSESEVGPATTDILIESAMFDPVSIRRTSRTLKLASDSSFRFERGVDPLGVELASRRAALLITELAGGQLATGVIRAGLDDPKPREAAMRVVRCNALLGLDLSPQRMVELLEGLGFSPRLDGGSIHCSVPSHRRDVEREVDLIEEVGRTHGLNSVPVHERIVINARALQPQVAARREAAKVLVAHGYHETVTFSLVSHKHGQPFIQSGEEPALVEDERRKAEPMLRPSVLPSLMQCRKFNQDLGNQSVRLYEMASVWSRGEGKIIERRRLGLLADANPSAPGESLRDLRGTVEELVSHFKNDAPVFTAVQTPTFSIAASVAVGGQSVGVIGIASTALQKVFDLQSPVVTAQLDLSTLLDGYPPAVAIRDLPRFPAIERDLSVVVDEAVTWEQIESHTRAAQPALLEDLRFVTTYRGKPVPAGKKSVSFRMVFRDPKGTLRHEQVDPQVAAVVTKLKETLGAELRA